MVETAAPPYGQHEGEWLEQLHAHETVPRVIRLTTPAVGAELVGAVPNGAVWLLHSIRFQLTTSAAAANRIPLLTFTDQTDEWFRLPFNITQIAAQTTIFCAYTGAALQGATNTQATAPLPMYPCILPPGTQIRTLTTAIDVADQYSAARVYAVEVTTEPYGSDQQKSERGMDLIRGVRF